jgi:hypothetical protein
MSHLLVADARHLSDGEGQKPISDNADHYPSREGSGRHLRDSTTDRMRIDPRNSLLESVPCVP